MTNFATIAAQVQSREPGMAVLAALNRLLQEDAHLLRVDANERSISHRFGMYLQAELPKHDIDCEYNRDADVPKRIRNLDLHPDVADTDGNTVFPDFIAHVRGTKVNYFVVEIKKTTSHVDRNIDRQKLISYKCDLNYESALFAELATDGQADAAQVEGIDA